MTTKQPKFTLQETLADNLYLVRRTTDDEILLARPLDSSSSADDAQKVAGLLHPRTTTAHALTNLLNHENLISIHSELVTTSRQPPPSPSSYSSSNSDSEPATKRMFLWDYCDAGTLQNVLDDFSHDSDPLAAGGFLPEGFVWHVALGLLRALQWLHEGARETYEVLPPLAGKGSGGGFEDGAEERCRRVRGRKEAEKGWMPVLHRDVRAENVFLQHPRGVETYGAVKLGNFERCWVAGSGGKGVAAVVGMEEEDVSFGVLRERKGRWERDGMEVDKSQRPYTQGSELFAVGAMLYHMMCGVELPPAEECVDCGCVHITSNDPDAEGRRESPCSHDCVGDVNVDEVFKPLFNYTADLKHLAMLLLRLNRNDEWWASAVLDIAWPGFENWAANTEDGRMHRDVFDDMWFRQQNQARRDRRCREVEEFDMGGSGGTDKDDDVLWI